MNPDIQSVIHPKLLQVNVILCEDHFLTERDLVSCFQRVSKDLRKLGHHIIDFNLITHQRLRTDCLKRIVQKMRVQLSFEGGQLGGFLVQACDQIFADQLFNLCGHLVEAVTEPCHFQGTSQTDLEKLSFSKLLLADRELRERCCQKAEGEVGQKQRNHQKQKALQQGEGPGTAKAFLN